MKTTENLTAPINPAVPAVPELKKKVAKTYMRGERILLLLALFLGILFDRLIANSFFDPSLFPYFFSLYGAFWISYLVLFYIFHWKEIKKEKILWGIAFFALLLCLQFFLFQESEYSTMTLVVLPLVLMAHAQLFAHRIGAKQVYRMALAWFTGLFILPFTAIKHFFGASSSLLKGEKSSSGKSLLLGAFLSIVLLCCIVPLLVQADQVFKYYLLKIFGNFHFGEFLFHAVLVFVAALLVYSFFWHTKFDRDTLSSHYQQNFFGKFKLAQLSSYFVLSSLIVVYGLFCSIQFTYLFAQAGLPAGMTYAAYAREGFAQIVAICLCNLLLLGLFLFFSGEKPSKITTALLLALLVVTSIILISGFLRLTLYINAYGMTWLRLLSLWFMIFLAAAIVICALRLFFKQIPAVFACALLLLVLYTALGYANPLILIANYNQSHGHAAYSYQSFYPSP